MSEDEMTEKEGYGTHGTEPVKTINVAGWPPEAIIPLAMEVKYRADDGQCWRATVNTDGSISLPDGMTGDEALLLMAYLSARQMFDESTLTPWAIETLTKWSGWHPSTTELGPSRWITFPYGQPE